jgi:hypothetical protein
MTEQQVLPPSDQPSGTTRREPWLLPLVLVAAAALLALVIMTLQLVDERSQLTQLRDAQAPQLQEANQFRERLQAIGTETARLADGGDATAKKIVDAMKQQGVTLKAPEK